jgi:hypothetical protein
MPIISLAVGPKGSSKYERYDRWCVRRRVDLQLGSLVGDYLLLRDFAIHTYGCACSCRGNVIN